MLDWISDLVAPHAKKNYFIRTKGGDYEPELVGWMVFLSYITKKKFVHGDGPHYDQKGEVYGILGDKAQTGVYTIIGKD